MKMNTVNKYFYFGLGIVIICLFPYLLNWENSYITIHDFLDGSYSHSKLITSCDAFFNNHAKLPIMDGIERGNFPFSSVFEFRALIAFLFPGFLGILINLMLVKIIAYIGMWLLTTRYIIVHSSCLPVIISLLFSLIPFYYDFGISSAGIPLLTYSILCLKEKKNIIVSFSIATSYAFYSSFVLSGMFVCIILFILVVVLYYEDRYINKYLIWVLISMTLIYLLANWSIIYGFVYPTNIIPHRYEWVNNLDIFALCKMLIINYIVVSQYHAGAFLAAPIIVSFTLVYLKFRRSDKSLLYYMCALIVLVLLMAIGIFVKLLPYKLFTSFQFDRFYFLYPALCFILLSKTCNVLYSINHKWMSHLLLIIILLCVGMYNIELINNIKILLGRQIDNPTYCQFYDEKLFGKIAKDLDAPQNYTIKVVSLGLFPAIPEYNGFWCLDGYMSSYSLEYKHCFRKVISRELDKNEGIRTYFDDWGNRCYLFSSELGNYHIFSKNENITVSDFKIDVNQLYNMGCQYIFSTVNIDNYSDLNLSFINNYSSNNSYYDIKVYKINRILQ